MRSLPNRNPPLAKLNHHAQVIKIVVLSVLGPLKDCVHCISLPILSRLSRFASPQLPQIDLYVAVKRVQSINHACILYCQRLEEST